MQESDISAKVRQSCFSDPFSLQSKQLRPDYVSSYMIIRIQEGMVCFWKATRLRWINHRNILVYFED